MERLTPAQASRGKIVGLLILGAVVTWWVVRPSYQSPDKEVAVAGPDVSPTVAEISQSPSDGAVTGRAPVAAASGEPVACVEQFVDVTAGEKKQQRSCVSRTQTITNGNVRTYRVESQGGAVSSLRVDAAGEKILHAELSMNGGEVFACGAGQCGGISLAPYDSQGARAVVFARARLSRPAQSAQLPESAQSTRSPPPQSSPSPTQSAEAQSTEETVFVDGRLRTLPDDQLASSACAGQVLLVSQGPGTQHFCPDSGTGFDLDEQGGTTYRFTNHDGDTLSVSMNRSGALERVSLGNHACAAPACAGVSISPAAADGRREFGFRGTTLPGNASEATPALLNGTVVLGAQ
jgi:hypothetical protein